MKDFNDFLNSFTQDDIDNYMQKATRGLMRETKAAYPELSDNDLIVSVAIGAASRLSIHMIGRYHDWLHQA
jgi:hypothetical protein